MTPEPDPNPRYTGFKPRWMGDPEFAKRMDELDAKGAWQIGRNDPEEEQPMPDNPTPDLDRLLRIAAAELPPGTTVEVRAGGGWYSLTYDKDGHRAFFASRRDLEEVATDVEGLLKGLGLLLTRRED